jgi:hypothetical protein
VVRQTRKFWIDAVYGLRQGLLRRLRRRRNVRGGIRRALCWDVENGFVHARRAIPGPSLRISNADDFSFLPGHPACHRDAAAGLIARVVIVGREAGAAARPSAAYSLRRISSGNENGRDGSHCSGVGYRSTYRPRIARCQEQYIQASSSWQAGAALSVLIHLGVDRNGHKEAAGSTGT